MGGLPDQRRREAGSDARPRVRGCAADPRGADGGMGARLAVRVRRDHAADRRRPAAHGDDPKRAALGLQGHEPPGRALCGPRVSDPAAGEAPARPELEDAVDPARPVGRVQPPDARQIEGRCRDSWGHEHSRVGHSRDGADQPPADPRDPCGAAQHASRPSPAGIARAPRRSRGPGRFRKPSTATSGCWTIRRSMPSIFPFPTAST